MTQRTAIVVGDLMLDRRIEGNVRRISPEAPVPVVNTTGITDAAGGAANVAINLAALGVQTQLIGAVGEDVLGKRLYQLILEAQEKFPLWPRIPISKAGTTVKTRITGNGQQLLRIDDEVSHHAAAPDILTLFTQALAAADVGLVIISDYAKGTLDGIRRQLVEMCGDRPVLVDTKPDLFDEYYGLPVALTPNHLEARDYADRHGAMHPGFTEDGVVPDAMTSAAFLQRKLLVSRVIVTCGKYGAVLARPDDDRPKYVAAEPREVADPTGAGDTFIAALGRGYLNRTSETSEQYLVACANTMAGLAVQHHGPAVITDEMCDEDHYNRHLPESKRMDYEQVAKYAARVRKSKGLVGFTNGCFDLLHPGHIATLEFARSCCNVLIVAYNSDESVRRLKGEGRPIVTAETRAKQLFPFADAVVCLRDDLVAPLLRLVRPDVYVKGMEYISAGLPDAAYVASYGGEVVYAPMVPGISTTALTGGT